MKNNLIIKSIIVPILSGHSFAFSSDEENAKSSVVITIDLEDTAWATEDDAVIKSKLQTHSKNTTKEHSAKNSSSKKSPKSNHQSFTNQSITLKAAANILRTKIRAAFGAQIAPTTSPASPTFITVPNYDQQIFFTGSHTVNSMGFLDLLMAQANAETVIARYIPPSHLNTAKVAKLSIFPFKGGLYLDKFSYTH